MGESLLSSLKRISSLIFWSILSLPMDIWRFVTKQVHIVRMGRKIPGLPALPILGNVLQIGYDSRDVFDYGLKMVAQFGTVFRLYLGPFLVTATGERKDHENFLSGYEYLNKGMLYEFLRPWLGTGLLISTGDKWRSRRKILTPAFHFKILDQFAPVFNTCGDVFIQQLRKKGTGKIINVWNPVKYFTLDVICETTMGVKVNAQTNSESEYVTAVNEIGVVIYEYALRPWLYPSLIFRFSSIGKRFNACLNILHTMTNKVIRERREELEKLNSWKTTLNVDELGRRRRLALLDILLLASRDGSLTDADIREEVDTFMFEGHDTTASGIAYTIYFLSLHEDVQEKIFEELKSLFDVSKPLEMTLSELSSLKYTEMVVKESLRIFPPVPAVSRQITSDYVLPSRGLTLPKGSELMTNFYELHRNPDVFPDPETFDPERFSPENSAGRNPFAYLPFSAGPRNCIGQKFAMLEMKSIIAKLVWNFRIQTDPDYTLMNIWEVTLKSKNGISIKLEDRQRDI